MKQLRIICLLVLPVNISWAEITTDGSVGPASILKGPDFKIGQELGTRTGNNLFHSFGRFNLNTKQSATFTGDSNIQNVISRVTGGEVSTINGLLKSEVGKADFYFINPAGIVFGNSAQIDVPAAFYTSTAAQLNFADGVSFNALDTQGNQLTVATPDSFGFTSDQTGQITITAKGLEFKPAAKVSISSQSINIGRADITGEGLQLQLIANGQQTQDISINALPDNSLQGDINIVQSSINISGKGSEQLVIRGGNTLIQESMVTGDSKIAFFPGEQSVIDIKAAQLEINNSVLSSDNVQDGFSGGIEIMVDNDLSIVNGGKISSSTFGRGNAGIVNISASNILIDSQKSDSITGVLSGASSSSFDGGGGVITVSSEGQLSVLNGGIISSNTFSTGDAGTININANTLLIDGQGSQSRTGILSDAGLSSEGRAGAITIETESLLSVLEGGIITSRTFAQGDAGKIEITAGELLIDGQGSALSTGISSDANDKSTGRAGIVSVTSDGKLSILNGGAISSSTFADGNAGKVNINVAELMIDRQQANSVTGIFSDATVGSEGDAGSVIVSSSGGVSIINGGVISSNTFSTGNAGIIDINSNTLVIDRQASQFVTGVISDAVLRSEGRAGDVTVSTDGLLSVLNGGAISSRTFAAGDAGIVDVRAGEILIDGQGTDLDTGISSDANTLSEGNAGVVNVRSQGLLSIRNGGAISSSTFTEGNAGKVNIFAGEVLVDRQSSDVVTGVFSGARASSSGDGGAVTVVTEGDISILNGGLISSNTFSTGDAGTVNIKADQLLIDRQGATFETGVFSEAGLRSEGNAGAVSIVTQGEVSLINGGVISSRTFAVGDAGAVDVKAGEVLIDRQGGEFATGIASDTSIRSEGKAGKVTVFSQGLLSVLSGGGISSSTASIGDAGSVNITAGEILIDGQDSALPTGFSSNASTGSKGNAGDVLVTSENLLSVLNGGLITSNTFAEGNAGFVDVTAGEVLINRQNASINTGILSTANPNSTGDAGRVIVTSKGKLSILKGGTVSSSTSGTGDAGQVTITVADDLLIHRQGASFETGITSSANASSEGRAGAITVITDGKLSILSGGVISSSTFSKGDAGRVDITVGELLVNNQGSELGTSIASNASVGSKGNAGEVNVSSEGLISILNGGIISSSTFAKGNAGKVNVSAKELRIDHQGAHFNTGISSSSAPDSTGHAGAVFVRSDGELSVLSGGKITSSSTFSTGNAGSVNVNAGEILVNGLNSEIASSATGDASGSVGAVVVESKGGITLSNGGAFKITSSSKSDLARTPIEPRIEVTANQIQLTDNSEISAASTGTLDASGIVINSESLFLKSESRITTSANEGNGGDITLTSQDFVFLRDSLVETSVTGSEGNGGDITVDTSVLVLDTGFIQANTAANNASGGDVNLNIESLITSGNELISGGNEPVGFVAGSGLNVIQAAAPDGLSGVITNEVPELDVTSALMSIDAPNLNLEKIGRNPCSPSGRKNTLKSIGLGGVNSFKKGQQQQTIELLLPQEDKFNTKALGQKAKKIGTKEAKENLAAQQEVTNQFDCDGKTRHSKHSDQIEIQQVSYFYLHE